MESFELPPFQAGDDGELIDCVVKGAPTCVRAKLLASRLVTAAMWASALDGARNELADDDVACAQLAASLTPVSLSVTSPFSSRESTIAWTSNALLFTSFFYAG
mgnify:CR=1 FL=1